MPRGGERGRILPTAVQGATQLRGAGGGGGSIPGPQTLPPSHGTPHRDPPDPSLPRGTPSPAPSPGEGKAPHRDPPAPFSPRNGTGLRTGTPPPRTLFSQGGGFRLVPSPVRTGPGPRPRPGPGPGPGLGTGTRDPGPVQPALPARPSPQFRPPSAHRAPQRQQRRRARGRRCRPGGAGRGGAGARAGRGRRHHLPPPRGTGARGGGGRVCNSGAVLVPPAGGATLPS